MGVSLTGVFSGIDSDSIISQIIAIDSQPLTALQNQKTQEQAKQSAESSISSILTQLQTQVDKLRGSDNVNQVSSSSSDTSVLGVSTGTEATEGMHTVVVNRLASSARLVNAGLASDDAKVGAGQFVYAYNGVTRTVQTTDTTTLADLRDLINNDLSNPGVTASILDHQVDDTHVAHLILTGKSSGSDYGIAVEAGTTLSGLAPGDDWLQTQAAQDSQFRVDGYPPSGWIERSTNTVTDAIPGVTLSLKDASADGVTVSIARDTGQLANGIQNIVSIYNTLFSTIQQYTGYDADKKVGGVLQGNSTFTDILSQVRSALTNTPAGFAGKTYATAADIGVSIDKDGKMSLDTDTLHDALAADYDGVLRLIGAVGAGASDSEYVQFQSAESQTQGGTYEVEVNFSDTGKVTSARIRMQGETDWRSAKIVGNSILGQENTAEEGLQFTATWDGSSTVQAANITVEQGFHSLLYSRIDAMRDDTTGPLALWKQASDDEITRLDDNIDTMQKRLKAQYARLEATLAQMSAQSAAVSAMINSFSSSSSSSSSSS